MAELTKKLHMINSSGTAQTAKIYSTTAEVVPHWLFTNVDGIPAYVPIGDITDSRATSGRVKGSGGDAYAILNAAKPAYTEMSWTTPGTYTWTAPVGVERVRVALVGGGAGCLMVTRQYSIFGTYSFSYSAGSGGTSSFGSLISATGGTGFLYNNSTNVPVIDGAGCATGLAGSPNGNGGWVVCGDHISSPTGYGAGFNLSFTKTIATYSTNYGSGGYGKGGYGYVGNPDENNVCATGASGGYNTGYVSVTSLTTYTITVGAGGAAYIYDTSNSQSHYAHNGNDGYVYIAFGGDI